MNQTLDYFARSAAMTNPGAYAYLFDHLPTQVDQLTRLVQNLTVHIFWADSYGLKLSPDRQVEVQLRTLENRLERTIQLDPRPLSESRQPEQKCIGNCRDFSLLLVSMLRRQGVPARARCGFATYFHPGHYVDHWVGEYWDFDRQRWVLVDAQLDDLQQGVLHIDFDPLDVPRDRFISGGLAWQLCRSGQADPALFGIFDLSGLDFVCGDLVRDIASLNKVELLPWDCWGVMLKESLEDEDDLRLLDLLADLAAQDVPDFEQVQRLYQNDPRLRVDGEIQSFVEGQFQAVRLNLEPARG